MAFAGVRTTSVRLAWADAARTLFPHAMSSQQSALTRTKFLARKIRSRGADVDVGSLHTARSRADTVIMEKITFGDAAVPGYERGEKTAPAVIVLQEWWGVTKNISAQAERIASEGGYRVLIPDLYKGKLGVNVEEAHHLMSNLDWPAAKGAIPHHAVATRALPPAVDCCYFLGRAE